MVITIEVLLVEYEVFLDELVNELVTMKKKSLNTNQPVINELFVSVQENPLSLYNRRSAMKLLEIIEFVHFGSDRTQLQNGAEILQHRYKKNLELLLQTTRVSH